MPEENAIDTVQVRESLDALYRAESGRILATLIRLLGDFDLAEDAMHDAFAAALERWPQDGVSDNPRAWLVSTGRFKAIDTLRRRARFDASQEKIAEELASGASGATDDTDESIEDDRLRLIFTCCHPALAPEGRLALTLREVCGLTTEEIARAFLTSAPTLAQRIVRAKAKIRDARLPYQVPSPGELPERLAPVLQVVYLVFNEGYFASSGSSLTRADLSAEAIRLGRLLVQLLPALAIFDAEGLAPFLPRWQALDALVGQTLRLTEGDTHVVGLCLGIAADGALRLRHVDGRVHDHYAGEASVRPA